MKTELNKRIAYLLDGEKNKKNSDRNQKALADAIGVPDGTLSRWLLKDRDIPAKHLPVIADFFGVSTDYLLGRTDNKEPVYAPGKKKEPTMRYAYNEEGGFSMSIKAYNVPETKLVKYTIKIMKDLFSCEDFVSAFEHLKKKSPPVYCDANGIPITLADEQLRHVLEKKCAEIPLEYDRLESFYVVYGYLLSHETNITTGLSKIYESGTAWPPKYPTYDEFENIALYVEKRKEYQPILDMLEKETARDS